jgi:hypothetical protein
MDGAGSARRRPGTPKQERRGGGFESSSGQLSNSLRCKELAPLLTELHQDLIDQGYTFATAAKLISGES